MFYPIVDDPKSLLAGYNLRELIPIDRRSPTDWTRIYFAQAYDDKEYVVRLSSTATTNNRERHLEHAIAGKLSENRIGPHIYLSSPEDGVLLMERLQPSELDPDNARHVEQLAKLLARLHAIDTNELPEIPLIADKYALSQARFHALFEATDRFPDHKAAFNAWNQLRNKLEGNVSSAVLCHNDVHVRNLLMDEEGNLGLIDNDHCSLGTGLYDLAASAISFNMSAETEKNFLRAYGTQVDDLLFLEYKKLVYLTYACMVFSFIQEYKQIDTDHVLQIDPSGGFGKLPTSMSRDTRLYTQSCSFLRKYIDCCIGSIQTA